MKGEKVDTIWNGTLQQDSKSQCWFLEKEDAGYIQTETRRKYGEQATKLIVGASDDLTLEIEVTTSDLMEALVKGGLTADDLRGIADWVDNWMNKEEE